MENNREKIAEKTRAWYQKNRALALKRAREAGLKKKYGITQAEFTKLMEGQDYRCKICLKEFDRKHPPVDHCHTTGKVRGILCYRCNTGLGQFMDNPIFLRNAIKYLAASRGQITA